jgi:hypothetical protein
MTDKIKKRTLPAAAVATQFKPGVSGNPSGRPKIVEELKSRCRDLTPKILERLEYWLGQDGDPAASIKAALILLDRGYGRSTEYLELSSNNSSAVVPVFHIKLNSHEPMAADEHTGVSIVATEPEDGE